MGKLLMLPGEENPPFAYMGLLNDYNNVQSEQSCDTVAITTVKYIYHVLETHG